ncbi:MAG: hypothetical protein ACJ8C4_15370 [Gemmataceae bacterium]
MRTHCPNPRSISWLIFACFVASPAWGADVLTYHNNNARTGLNDNESQLRPGNVTPATFGPLYSRILDGHVYAQPLYKAGVPIAGQSRNVVYVATQHNTVYAFNADDSNTNPNTAPLWRRSLLLPGESPVPSNKNQQGDNDVHNFDIWPEIGVTGTPVIDGSTGTLYVVSKAKVLSAPPSYVHRLHALDLATGDEKFGGPVEINGVCPGTGNGFFDPNTGNRFDDHDGADSTGQRFIPFRPLLQHQRAGLLLCRGLVYVAFASHGDTNPYHGWLFGFDSVYLRKPPIIFNTTPDGGRGGIWQGGAGPAADDEGNIYFATGNGTVDPNSRNFGDSVLKLKPGASAFKVGDFFTPTAQIDQSDPVLGDMDLGAGGVVLLPRQAPDGPDLLVIAGKERKIHLLDRNNLGRFGQGPGGSDASLQGLTNAVNEKFGLPAFFDGKLYYAGNGDPIKLFQFNQGTLAATPISSNTTFPKAPTPSVSSLNNQNGIVWVIRVEGYQPDKPAVLYAYHALTLAELYNSTQGQPSARDLPGPAIKHSIPTIADGKVFVGSQYRLTVFGLREP